MSELLVLSFIPAGAGRAKEFGEFDDFLLPGLVPLFASLLNVPVKQCSQLHQRVLADLLQAL